MYEYDWSSIPGALPFLVRGMGLSLLITVVAIIAGMLWGTALAFMRLSSSRALSVFATVYVSVFRSLPLVLVLLWFFLVVPKVLASLLGLSLSTDLRLPMALVGFSLFEAAYYSEIIRAGIQAVPSGQLAAAQALGMTTWQAMRLVILPQAYRHMLPILLTQCIILFQDTSLVYVVSMADFFGVAQKIGERDGRLVELLLFAGGVYLILCYAASLLVKKLERRATS